MSRTKERPKLIHQATTQEYLYCLGNMPKWSQVLSDHTNGKPYQDFLKWILQQQYFKDEEKISVKRISELSGYPSPKISKWLKDIYEDILKLNDVQPSLFYLQGSIEVELWLRYFDSYCLFKTRLSALPKLYESFDFFFVKAKVGISSFWVKDVRHIIEDNRVYVCISLDGGIVNIYREFALSKALFEGTLNFDDVYRKFDFEIDKLLLKRR